MRKLIVSMNVTLDGFLSGPNCELDWHFTCWTAEMAEALGQQLERADTILLGRVTYLAMAKYWPAKAMDVAAPREDLAFIQMMNRYRKIVFSKTLTLAEWHNSTVANKNLAEEIRQLKQQSGKDLMLYGSAKLVAALVKLNLVDEYQLWVHPVVLGKGKSLFKTLPQRLSLALLQTKVFCSGVTLLVYQVENVNQPKKVKGKKYHEKETAN